VAGRLSDLEVLLLAVCGTISSCGDYEEIVEWRRALAFCAVSGLIITALTRTRCPGSTRDGLAGNVGGYGPQRRIQTGIGALEIGRPKVRDRAAALPPSDSRSSAN
jgi:hypothetical protein